jgi:cytochrome b561
MSKQTKKQNTDQSPFGALTTVKTVYARAVLLLLTFNFCLTGYAMYSLTQLQTEAFSAHQSAVPTQEVRSAPTE